LALLLLHTLVPDPDIQMHRAETGANVSTMRQLLNHAQLLRLDASIFVLHMIITATFFVVPLALRDLGLAAEDHWQVYLPAMALSAVVLIPMLMAAERAWLKPVLLACVAGLFGAQVFFLLVAPSVTGLFVGILLFFSFLNVLESLFPSLVSRIAPADAKGSAMGVYSSSQFLGGFIGGAGGGWLYGIGGADYVFTALAVVCLIWLFVLRGFVSPPKLVIRRHRLTANERGQISTTLAKLQALPGVAEVAFVEAEGLAYLKVDKSTYDPDLSSPRGSG